jgi:hypothetical protein
MALVGRLLRGKFGRFSEDIVRRPREGSVTAFKAISNKRLQETGN